MPALEPDIQYSVAHARERARQHGNTANLDNRLKNNPTNHTDNCTAREDHSVSPSAMTVTQRPKEKQHADEIRIINGILLYHIYHTAIVSYVQQQYCLYTTGSIKAIDLTQPTAVVCYI